MFEETMQPNAQKSKSTFTNLDDSDLDSKLKDLKTGDIILFTGKDFWFSKLIRWYTGTPWTHVGVVLRDPTYIDPKLTGLYLWESGLESFVDSENGIRKLGIQISDLKKALEDPSHGKAVYRKLNSEIHNLDDKLKIIHEGVHNKPYDTSLLDFLQTSLDIEFTQPYGNNLLHLYQRNYRKTDTFYCSAFLAYLFTELSLLPKDTKWSICEPAYFSETNKKFILENGHMGPEITLITH